MLDRPPSATRKEDSPVSMRGWLYKQVSDSVITETRRNLGHTKKTSVSGVAAGWFKNVRIGTFFSFLQQFFFFFFFQKWTIFSYRNKTKQNKTKKCGLPTGF